MSACRRHYPGRIDETDSLITPFIDFGLPQITVGSAPALSVSWPAQRSLALQPADSPSRLMRPSTPEAPAALLPPPPLRLLPGGAIQFPGGFISRCGPAPFTAHCYRLFSSVDLTSYAAGPLCALSHCSQGWLALGVTTKMSHRGN